MRPGAATGQPPWSGSLLPATLALVISLRPRIQGALGLTCLALWVRAQAMLPRC